MAESKNDLTENKKKRPNKLTNARIKKENPYKFTD